MKLHWYWPLNSSGYMLASVWRECGTGGNTWNLFLFYFASSQKPGYSRLSPFQWIRGGLFHLQERGRVRYGKERLVHDKWQKKCVDSCLLRGMWVPFLSILSFLHLQNEEGDKKYAGLLEKKWTSVIRLQKKVRNVVCFPEMSHV